MRHIKLSQTNDLMPTLGLGTWQAPPEEVESAVYKALDVGYRHLDTAFNYNNEEAIGKAVKNWIDDGKGARADLFITTKLPHVGNRASDVRMFLELQLKRLQMSYVDLYLIHVPFGFKCDLNTLTPVVKENGDYELDMKTDLVSTWQVNITVLTEHTIFFKWKGWHGDRLEITYYEASPSAFPDLFTLPDVKAIAERYGKTPPQVLLHFLVHEQIVVIPKSTNEIRLKENCDIYDFELTSSEVECLRKLDKGENGRIFNFLFWKGVENHPEYPFKIQQSE